MKTTKTIFAGLLAIAAALFISCDKNLVTVNMGKDGRLDENSLTSSSVSLKSMRSTGKTVYLLLTEDGMPMYESLYAAIKRPSSLDQTVIVNADPSLAEAYIEATGTEYEIFPTSYCTIGNGGIFKIAAGEKYSEPLQITFSTSNHLENSLKPGRYLLPVVASASAQGMSDEVIYYDITVREPFTGDGDLYDGKEIFFVFYLNTTQYDPRLVTDYYMNIMDLTGGKPGLYATIGNVINLRKMTVDYDISSGRAIFNLGSDMRYVLDHYSKYITPLQEEGRKVCLSIEGANTGLGFCNMTDSQIEDFVEQVKIIFDNYPLDGINLWDRNSGYDKSIGSGLPEMNTTSYPKLIMALREMLGPDRLLTLTDYEEPTEYFWNTDATGGIRVGELLDYAWSGYCDANEGIQVIDPWHQGEEGVSTLYPRKPIAGLEQEKYGCVNIPWTPKVMNEIWTKGETDLETWCNAGYRQSNILLFEELRTNLQDANETNWDSGLWAYPFMFNTDFGMSLFDKARLWTFEGGSGSYGKWLKDW